MTNRNKSIPLGPDKRQSEIYVRYADGDLVIFKDLNEIPKLDGTFEVTMLLCLICIKGRLKFDYNGEDITVSANDMLICPPGTKVDDYMVTPDFESMIFGISYSKFQQTVFAGQGMWSMMMYVKEHPIFHLSDEEMMIGHDIFHLIRKKLDSRRDFFFKEVMQSLMITAFYEISIVINRSIIPGARNETSRQGDLIFKRFLQMLSESDGRRRSVSDYARELCISPKYLSSATREASGKSALEWIHDYSVNAIAQQLKYSDRSIKEIAGDFQFSSISVFGKFVKTKLGMSPREYRKQSRALA
ncbi:MAG: AraC family transcriptional regulator [Bacteroidales bacterium]|nr:AraC family transcriptional regulator [Bacteroidales bacterium]